MNKMPKITKQNIVDRIGSALLEAVFSDQMIFIPHSGNSDFGIDYSVELFDKEKNTTLGIFLSLQLKSHETIEFDDNGNYSQSVKVESANYWLNTNTPVVIVLVDNTKQKFYGLDVKKAIRENYDFDKMKNQETISIHFNDKNVFDINTCVKAFIEDEKYNLLKISSVDSLTIYNFLSYINENYNRDWFSLVDDYSDMTREIISFSEKYGVPFAFDKEILFFRKKMIDSLKNNYSNGFLSYDNYKELERSDFNKNAAEYLVELTKKICIEIDNDKTLFLKKRLNKFKRLKKIIEERGMPCLNREWANCETNALNDDYAYDESEI